MNHTNSSDPMAKTAEMMERISDDFFISSTSIYLILTNKKQNKSKKVKFCKDFSKTPGFHDNFCEKTSIFDGSKMKLTSPFGPFSPSRHQGKSSKPEKRQREQTSSGEAENGR
jgi:hypothetical protein